MNIEQLEQEAAARLSSFEGEYEGYEGYDGYNDPFVDFAGIEDTFASEISSGRLFTMTIVNANASTRYAYLCPGYGYDPNNINLGVDFASTSRKPLPVGVVNDGAFLDANGDSGLTGSGSPKTIQQFLRFIQYNPLRVLGFKIQSTVTTQIQQVMTVQAQSPFRTLESQNITLGSYQDENTYQNNIVTVPEVLDFNDQNQILLPIVGSSTLTITLFGGAILNTASALNKKAAKAGKNIQRRSMPARPSMGGAKPNLRLLAGK